MNSTYSYPQHSLINQNQQQSVPGSATSMVNPAMLQGQGQGAQGAMGSMGNMSTMGGMNGMGMNSMGGMGGMGMQGMSNMGMNAAMAARQNMMSGMGGMSNISGMSGMGGMNMGGGMSGGGMNAMGMPSRSMSGMSNMPNMGNMSNMDMVNFKAGGGSGGSDGAPAAVGGGGMGINPSMLGSGAGINPGMAGMNAAGGGNGMMSPAMMQSSSSGQGSGITPEMQKLMAQRQASLGMNGMNMGMGGMGMGNMAGMNGMGGMQGMNNMSGMGLNMGMMGGMSQQTMQQFLAQQQQQQQHQHQHQHQHQQQQPQTPQGAPAVATNTGLSVSGNPYPSFPNANAAAANAGMSAMRSQTQQHMAPPPRPNTAMSSSSQPSGSHLPQHQHHNMGMGIARPPTASGQQQMVGRSISRPGTASGHPAPPSAGASGDPPHTPRTPQLGGPRPGSSQGMVGSVSMPNMNQGQGQGQIDQNHTLSQSQGQQHQREMSRPPSRPQTAGSNHGGGSPGTMRSSGGSMNGVAGMNGMNAIGGMNGRPMNGMPGMSGMVGMPGMPGINTMSGMGGMMPPPTHARQGSLGPQGMATPQSSMQNQAPHPPTTPHTPHTPNAPHSPAQANLNMGASGLGGGQGSHDSPTPQSAGMARTPSVSDGMSGMAGMGNVSGGDDASVGGMMNMAGMNNLSTMGGMGMNMDMANIGAMGNMNGMNNMATMGAMGGMSGMGNMGMGGLGMSQLQQMHHMQAMQQRKAITMNAYQQAQAARLQQQGLPNGPQVPTPSAGSVGSVGSMGSMSSMGPSGSTTMDPSAVGAHANMGMNNMNVGMNQSPSGVTPNAAGAVVPPQAHMQGTPTRPPTSVSSAGRGSVPPGSAGMGMMGMSGMPGGAMGGSQLPTTPVRPGTSTAGTASTTPGVAPSSAGVSTTQSVNGTASTPAINGGSAPASSATTQQASLNAINAAGLPPLPAQVQLNPSVTRVSVVPLAESREKIPELTKAEIEDIKGWMEKDKEYEKRFRAMLTRSQAELRLGPGGTRPRWWERDQNNSKPKEKFDLQYPHVPSSRDSGRKRNRKREGLKIPGRLKIADAIRGEQLVPIRLEFDVEHQKYRDTFVWNINDPIVTPEAFAQSIIDDYGLSPSLHSTITKSIQEQLSDYRAHTATLADVSSEASSPVLDVGEAPPVRGILGDQDVEWWNGWKKRLRNNSGYVRTRKLLKREEDKDPRLKSKKRKKGAIVPKIENLKKEVDEDSSVDVEMLEIDEDKLLEEMRILVKLDITVGEVKLDDQFEWDIENVDPTPEQFAEIYSSDLGLAGEFKTAIAHAIREQVAIYQKSLFLVGHPSDGSAIQDDDLRMSFLPTVSTAARPVDQTPTYQPVINYLSDNELERLDKEREKEANRRRKRNTRGRRGIALPDREPLKTQRTPAIGFPEIDPSTLALVAAASAPTSRRAAAAAASVTIANMVASENGTAVIPTISAAPVAPVIPQSKLPKPRGSFKAPSYPSTLLGKRGNSTSAIPSTAVDTTTFEPPIEGDQPLPAATVAVLPPDPRTPKVLTARRQRELEREAKEREYADGQRPNMIDGVWHCSNCGCPDSIAIGRRKGPLGDKSQCGACGKFWHRHRRPRPVEYHSDAEYHLNLRMEVERAKASGKKKGGAAALRALSIQQSQSQDQAETPASMTDDPSSPTITKIESWGENGRSPKKGGSGGGGRASLAPDHDALGLLDRPLSPASSVSSSASDQPLAQGLFANGSGSKPGSAAVTPLKTTEDLPAQPETPNPPPVSAVPLASEHSTTPVTEQESTPSQAPSLPLVQRPKWMEDSIAEMQAKSPDDRFDITLRKQPNGNPPEWRIKCLDCPGKLYTLGPGETLSNFEVHLKNRQHRAKVQARVNNGSVATPVGNASTPSTS